MLSGNRARAGAGGEVREALGTGPRGTVRASSPDGRYHVLTGSPHANEATVPARNACEGHRVCRESQGPQDQG